MYNVIGNIFNNNEIQEAITNYNILIDSESRPCDVDKAKFMSLASEFAPHDKIDCFTLKCDNVEKFEILKKDDKQNNLITATVKGIRQPWTIADLALKG